MVPAARINAIAKMAASAIIYPVSVCVYRVGLAPIVTSLVRMNTMAPIVHNTVAVRMVASVARMMVSVFVQPAGWVHVVKKVRPIRIGIELLFQNCCSVFWL